MKLEDDHRCFACGSENPRGLYLKFQAGGRGVMAFFTPEKEFQGYKDIVHGGIITTLMDEAMAHAAIKAGFMPVTAEISIRFRNALHVGQRVQVEGWMEGAPSHRLIGASSELKIWPEGALIATAKAKLLLPE
ncbi:MAG: PaaI family thioesterase [Nitrospiraceae bacterium]|nr:PaaI family thioesterase [Nitrospiraceae bacterium]